MKLLLCSEGFYTEAEVAKTEELVGKPRQEISVAVINEAYAVEHDNNLTWVLDNLNSVRDNFGGKSELVNLLALDTETVKQRIQKHDVIYVIGGHTDYLMSVFQKTGFDQLLPELLRSKVYVGSSAGSMVVGQRISTEAYAAVYGEEGDYGVTRYAELVDFAVIPHLNSEAFPGTREDIVLIACAGHQGTVYAINDNTALVVDGGELYSIGDRPLKIIAGVLE